MLQADARQGDNLHVRKDLLARLDLDHALALNHQSNPDLERAPEEAKSLQQPRQTALLRPSQRPVESPLSPTESCVAVREDFDAQAVASRRYSNLGRLGLRYRRGQSLCARAATPRSVRPPFLALP